MKFKMYEIFVDDWSRICGLDEMIYLSRVFRDRCTVREYVLKSNSSSGTLSGDEQTTKDG